MATRPPDETPSRPTSTVSKRNELYNLCAETPDKIYRQKDLEDFKVTSSAQELLLLCQDLVLLHLFQMFTFEGVVCWRLRDRVEAKRIAQLTQHEALVYNTIECTQRQGIWTRTLKSRTNLHQSVLTKCLKTLESHKLIKVVKNAKFPGRKIFMLYYLNPGDDVTGGPWFSEGELDSSFIELIAELVVDWVRAKSWRMGEKVKVPGTVAPADRAKRTQRKDKLRKGSSATPAPADGERNGTPGPAAAASTIATTSSKDKHPPLLGTTADTTSAKRKRTSETELQPTPPPDIESTPPPPSSLPPPTIPHTNLPIGIDPHTHRQLLPHPPGYTEYPSASDILTWIEATGIVSSKNLTLGDLNTLLDVLVFDGKLERVGKRRIGAGFQGGGEETDDGTPEPGPMAGGDGPDQPQTKATQSAAVKTEDTEPPAKKKRKVHTAEAATLTDSEKSDTDDDIRAPPRRRNKNDNTNNTNRPHTTTPSAADNASNDTNASSDSDSSSSSTTTDDEDTDEEYYSQTEPLYRACLIQPPVPSDATPPLQTHADGTTAAADELHALGMPAVPPGWGGNGFSETPCARCPAFGVCEEGGPVDAGSCGYWGPWLRGAGVA